MNTVNADERTAARCPQTLYGKHATPDHKGECRWCGAVLKAPAYRDPNRRAPQLPEQDVDRALRSRSPSGPVDETGCTA